MIELRQNTQDTGKGQNVETFSNLLGYRILSSSIKFCVIILPLACIIAVTMLAKSKDPFIRLEFTLSTTSSGRVNCVAILPKPVGSHPVVIYLQGAGGSLQSSGHELRQVAELGLAAIGLEYCQTNQDVFDEQFIALRQYLQQQPWAQSNATAWVGFSLGAQRMLSFALRHPEFQPQLLVRRAGGWVGELEKAIGPSSNPQRPSDLIKCPVLLVHGERDEVFPVADCRRLAELLRSNGTPVEVRVLPESGHVSGEDSGPVVRALADYCTAKLPLTDYAVAVPGCQLTSTEAQRFNLSMHRAGQHRRELWRAVKGSREPERRTVMNVIGGLEDYDLAHITSAQLREAVHVAWQARLKYPWCRDTPLEVFEKFAANPRIYEEPLGMPSFPMVLPRLGPRFKYCHNTGEACDAVGAWLWSRLRLRTAPWSAESSLPQMLKAKGWCKEGAMMYNYLGRSAGLSMRPSYVIWPTLGTEHWFSEVWSIEENQWHAVDSSNQDRVYGTAWLHRVPKSTILSTTGERGGWNATEEKRWEAFTNTVGLHYPHGQITVRVRDHDQLLEGQRVIVQTWTSNEVSSVAAVRTGANGEARLTLGKSIRYPYRILVEKEGETSWEWLDVQPDRAYTVNLNMEQIRPFDRTVEPPLVNQVLR